MFGDPDEQTEPSLAERRRHAALAHAEQLLGGQTRDADEVLDAARVFEAYLSGPEPSLPHIAFGPCADMKRFLATRVVNARPMNRLAYNKLHDWALPADENSDDEGYLVEYTDRISWSPKDVFERAFRAV